MSAASLRLLLLGIAAASFCIAASQDGEQLFAGHCVLCHGGDGQGTNRAQGILEYGGSHSADEIAAFLRTGAPARGMPAFDLPEDILASLAEHVRTLAADWSEEQAERVVELRVVDGDVVRGTVLNESGFDTQLRDEDGRIHLLRHKNGGTTRADDGASADWPTYHGNDAGNRHSQLDQIHRGNVSALAPAWFFPVPDHRMIEGTPVVVDGIMYVTGVNQVFALDAATGRQIWSYGRPRSEGLVGDAAIGLNRGVAIRGDLLFSVTDNAHAFALNRWTGDLVWDIEMADSRDHYGAIAAPLVVDDLVIVGISGGDTGLRGFLDAYYAETGKLAWRFWTIPAPGEPGSETWGDPEVLEKGCGATWLTGSYDPDIDTLYWAAGNPCPDLNGDRRPGDNLYTNSVLALEPSTGNLKWYFQFTPHDTHDWDAQEPLLLIDEEFRGVPRKLLVQANRNGFFYVLDRVTGEFLLGEPFVKQTWAEGLDSNGRPMLLPGSDPTEEGSAVCPAIRGATNWWASSYSDRTKLFYLMVHEACMVYSKNDDPWRRGQSWLGGTARHTDDSPNRRHIRALDIQTGKTVWDHPQTGGSTTYSGVLSTAGDLVFYGDDSGAFAALDATNGEPLWHFQANQTWKASPMTYMMGGRQYVAIGSGMGFWAFALATSASTGSPVPSNRQP